MLQAVIQKLHNRDQDYFITIMIKWHKGEVHCIENGFLKNISIKIISENERVWLR